MGTKKDTGFTKLQVLGIAKAMKSRIAKAMRHSEMLKKGEISEGGDGEDAGLLNQWR